MHFERSGIGVPGTLHVPRSGTVVRPQSSAAVGRSGQPGSAQCRRPRRLTAAAPLRRATGSLAAQSGAASPRRIADSRYRAVNDYIPAFVPWPKNLRQDHNDRKAGHGSVSRRQTLHIRALLYCRGQEGQPRPISAESRTGIRQGTTPQPYPSLSCSDPDLSRGRTAHRRAVERRSRFSERLERQRRGGGLAASSGHPGGP